MVGPSPSRANPALHPCVLVSVVALSLGLRLVFEQALFGYYFMAVVVTLVLLDVVAGHIRDVFVCWLAMVTVVYLVGPTTSQEVLRRSTWGHDVELALTPVVVLIAVLVILIRIGRGGPRRDHLVWIGLLVGVLLAWPSTNDPFSSHLPTAFRQVVLVSVAVLAVKPSSTWYAKETSSYQPEGRIWPRRSPQMEPLIQTSMTTALPMPPLAHIAATLIPSPAVQLVGERHQHAGSGSFLAGGESALSRSE